MALRRGVIAGALLGALLLPAIWSWPSQRTAQAASGWTVPFAISDDDFGWFPDLAADAQGAVHVIWGSGAQNPDADPDSPEASLDLLRYRVLRGGVWSPMNDIAYTCVGGYTVRNSIVANGDGRLNVLVRNCFDVSAFSVPADKAWSANAWSPLQRLGGAYYNAIAADSKGTLHALYNEALAGTADSDALVSEIFYRQSTDGGQTWSLRTNIASLPGGDQRMQIKVDGRDRVHVVWEHGSDWYLAIDHPEYGVYRRSDNGGQTWQEARLLGVGDGPVVQMTLGLTADGSPIVVYRSAFDRQIYFQTSADGGDTWHAAQQLPGVLARDPIERGLDSYTMATDNSGRVHLLVSGLPEGSVAAIPILLHLSWDGELWSAPEVVAATPNRPLWPRMVVSGGNQLHAAWFTYTDASGWGDRRVWYSSKVVDAPAVPPPPPIMLPAALPATAPPPLSPTPHPGEAVSSHADLSTAPEPVPLPAAISTFRDTPPPAAIAGTQSSLALVLVLVPALGLLTAMILLMLYRRAQRQ